MPFGRSGRIFIEVVHQSHVQLENVVMINLPRLATLEARLNACDQKMAALDANQNRMVQRVRYESDLIPSAPAEASAPPLTANLAEAAPVQTLPAELVEQAPK